VLLLAACGTAPDTTQAAAAPADAPVLAPPTPGAPATDTAAPDDETAVEQSLRRYYAAVLERDFAAACALNAPESIETLLDNARSEDLPATTCEDALAAIYAVPGAAEVADGIARTTRVEDVAVTGDTASVTWSGEVAGERVTVTSDMRRVDGAWKLVDVG
jgi:hypothetical protein